MTASRGGFARTGWTAGARFSAARPDPEHPLAAEQADGVRLVHQAHRIAGDDVTFETHELERVIGIVDRAPGQRAGTLVARSPVFGP